jgi:DNA-binding transcriptional regulator YdaS (Cro superfamily)
MFSFAKLLLTRHNTTLTVFVAITLKGLIFAMQLSKYLEINNISKADFAAKLGVSPAMIHQWINGTRPISEKNCVAIEKFTNGQVTRQLLRPNDFLEIWPELAAA